MSGVSFFVISDLFLRMSQAARTSTTKKPSDTLRPCYYTAFQTSCAASKANATSATQSKDVLPIPAKFKADVERLLTPINELLIEELSKIAAYTSVIPHEFFEKTDAFQTQKYLIDRGMFRTLEDAEIINWCRKLRRLFPIRTSGNGNCLLHAVLIAMIGIHDTNLYLRDRLASFMADNTDLLKIERLKSDQKYGINCDEAELDRVSGREVFNTSNEFLRFFRNGKNYVMLFITRIRKMGKSLLMSNFSKLYIYFLSVICFVDLLSSFRKMSFETKMGNLFP